MGLWRCQRQSCSTDPHGRCVFDFEDRFGKCPKCGATHKANPQVVIKLQVLHFDPPGEVIADVQRGKNHFACEPGKPMQIGSGNVATGDPSVVNCPKCKLTEDYLRAIDEWDGAVVEAENTTVEINLAGQVFGGDYLSPELQTKAPRTGE